MDHIEDSGLPYKSKAVVARRAAANITREAHEAQLAGRTYAAGELNRQADRYRMEAVIYGLLAVVEAMEAKS